MQWNARTDLASPRLLGMCMYFNKYTLRQQILIYNLQMLSSFGIGPLACLENGVLYFSFNYNCPPYPPLTHSKQIWKTGWTPVKVAYLFCRYVFIFRPYLNTNHHCTLATGLWPLFRISYMPLSPITPKQSARKFTGSVKRIYPAFLITQLPVRSLSRWPCGTKSGLSVRRRSIDCIRILTCMPAVLLIRTYAFFNRNNYLLAVLLCALAGVVGYQLFVDTSEMMRGFLSRRRFQFSSQPYQSYLLLRRHS
jgi:hypothetical protein